MISGANEEELNVANDRADLLLELDKYKNVIDKIKEIIEKYDDYEEISLIKDDILELLEEVE